MAFSTTRTTTWVSGQTLTAAALNTQVDALLANDVALYAGTVAVGTRVSGLTGSITSGTATFAANGHYVMRTTNPYSNSHVVVSTATLTINAQTAGPAANGRDQAAVFTATEVHWYAISTGANSTAPAGLVSSQPPPLGPVLPSGYSGWTYLSASKYNMGASSLGSSAGVGSNTTAFDQYVRGAWTVYKNQVPCSSGGYNGTASTAEQSFSLDLSVPSNALRYRGEAEYRLGASGDITQPNTLRIKQASGETIATIKPTTQTTYTSATVGGIHPFEAPNVNSPAAIYFNLISASTVSEIFGVSIIGYANPNGDV